MAATKLDLNTASVVHLKAIKGIGPSRAEEIVRSSDATSAVYIATCATDGLDDEMRERIASHVAGRPAGWRTKVKQK